MPQDPPWCFMMGAVDPPPQKSLRSSCMSPPKTRGLLSTGRPQLKLSLQSPPPLDIHSRLGCQPEGTPGRHGSGPWWGPAVSMWNLHCLQITNLEAQDWGTHLRPSSSLHLPGSSAVLWQGKGELRGTEGEEREPDLGPPILSAPVLAPWVLRQLVA